MSASSGLQPFGLYDPSTEHDACGVGFIANIKGNKSHKLVEQGVEILVNLTHRGACGCDPETGDGCGVLTQIPHDFFKGEVPGLPAAGTYGVGMFFLPPDRADRDKIVQAIYNVILEHGQETIALRNVPVNSDKLGWLARESEPHIAQVFIGGWAEGTPSTEIEDKLYLIRKGISAEVMSCQIPQHEYFYCVSMSSSTIIYKGLMLPEQITAYYPDLANANYTSAITLVHQRYSTNTFPSWRLAHPYRFLAHNGEINTLRGNMNWMKARENQFTTEKFGDNTDTIKPIILEGASDSAAFDNVLELLVRTGRPLHHAMMMMIPEAWEKHETMSKEKKAFYEYHSCIMEPWDGPASMAFTDGKVMGATLDRNGLRPSRYWVTKDDMVIMASEAGVLQIPPDQVLLKGRLQPGRMFLVDTEQGRIIPDEEIKASVAGRQPYGQWLEENLVRLNSLPEAPKDEAAEGFAKEELLRQLQAFGYTTEDLKIIVGPMARSGEEPIGSMGNDAALAVLSDRPQLLYSYFKQLFAQVTNPPLDAIREELVTSQHVTLGSEQDLFTETPKHCQQLALDYPIVTTGDLAKIRALNQEGLKSTTIPILYDPTKGPKGLRDAINAVCEKAEAAIEGGSTIIILSDRGVTAALAPIPALLATAGVHHHLIRQGSRTRCGLVVETAEAREVHHCCLLIGYGAGAVNPYLGLEVVRDMVLNGVIENDTVEHACKFYVKGLNKGVLKVMSKMGISTAMSYRGAQIFEAVGLNREVINRYFTWTASRVEGVGLDVIAGETQKRHARGFPARNIPASLTLDNGGQYQWRRDGEQHYYTPETVAKLQLAVRAEDPADGRKTYKEYAALINDQSKKLMTLRGLLKFKETGKAIPIEKVEPASEIVKRFATGAMSFGSISFEAHTTLALAMNKIGGRSNTGEGGEDPERFSPDPRNSAIKQVASGRFGVTSAYLVSANELQIKMAQGAKPGEGGQLPGHKVSEWIARTRHSTPGVGLISPPPHHDIYSIEDLAQLIHDLKNSNRRARISVKLVSEVGVGTIAAGVAKGKADVVLISGDSGGTGASPQTSIKHAGLPWELGLAETHQVLVRNGLRDRIVVQTDGQLKTGRDVAIACLLGAEEFGFATAPLIAVGCIMMRKCHLNTCPVGVATQDEELRKKFSGQPEHVINFLFMVAEELREIMASLGFEKITDMVGRMDMLELRGAIDHWKAKGLDLSPLLAKPESADGAALYHVQDQDHGLDASLDLRELLEICRPAIDHGKKVRKELKIRNVNRTVGTITGSELTLRHPEGLPDDTIHIKFNGSAGQSFAAFTPKGMTFEIEGDANDYFGKGLSGARLVIYPPKESTFVAEDNIIVGNVAFYGATGGEAFIRGQGGERFCVRNSGVKTVVEGIGDHGCEYMTGGRVIVLGPTGRNFAAGMSGGVAYILDPDGTFAGRCNKDMVALEKLVNKTEIEQVRTMIERHFEYTQSLVARRVLDQWNDTVPKFVKVLPHDYRRVLLQWQKEARPGDERAKLAEVLVGAGT